MQAFEQSNWEENLATPGSILTEPHYRDENFKFCETFETFYKFSEIIEKIKNKKTSFLENYKNFSSHIQKQDSQPLRVPSQYPTTGLRSSTFWKFLKSKFLKIQPK